MSPGHYTGHAARFHGTGLWQPVEPPPPTPLPWEGIQDSGSVLVLQHLHYVTSNTFSRVVVQDVLYTLKVFS